MDDRSNKKGLLKEWINLRTAIYAYIAIILLPGLGVAGAKMYISSDLKEYGYEFTDNDVKDFHISTESLKLLIPGKTFMEMCDILNDADNFHDDAEYRSLVIKNGLEKGLIKKITFNQHQ
jgi:hypothetical protein